MGESTSILLSSLSISTEAGSERATYTFLTGHKGMVVTPSDITLPYRKAILPLFVRGHTVVSRSETPVQTVSGFLAFKYTGKMERGECTKRLLTYLELNLS